MDETHESSAGFTVSRPLRVLVVDDHALMAEGVVAFLNRHKNPDVRAEVCSARGCGERLAGGGVDAVVVDISMGALDGIHLVEGWRREFPKVPFFIFSMSGDAGNLSRALRAGVSGYVLKEDAPEEIIQALGAGSPASPYLSPGLRKLLPGLETASAVFSRLSQRELQVLTLLPETEGNKELAARLGVGVKTVETHKEKLKNKLNVPTTAALRGMALLWCLRQHSADAGTRPTVGG